MSSEVDVLVVARLSVCSSYGLDVTHPATDAFDTVQFYAPADGDIVWRIRTFALDHDIHIHRIGRSADWTDSFVRAHLDRVYGDVTTSVHSVALPSLSTRDLAGGGIHTGELEVVTEAGWVFWNPDGGKYRTRSEPAGPGERENMQQVIYLGGIARFWVPASWQVEMSVEDGGSFYDPDGDSVLRLSVLTFDTTNATAEPNVRHKLKDGERAIDGGRLPTGHQFDVYEVDDLDDDTRIRFWQTGQILPGQCRVFVFSYAYPITGADALADELAVVDREVRRMFPYPEPV